MFSEHKIEMFPSPYGDIFLKSSAYEPLIHLAQNQCLRRGPHFPPFASNPCSKNSRIHWYSTHGLDFVHSIAQYGIKYNFYAAGRRETRSQCLHPICGNKKRRRRKATALPTPVEMRKGRI